MDANRFFSVPYDNRNDVKIRRLRKRLGGMAAYGRWIALLGMLYDENGLLDLNDVTTREIVLEELELDDADEFFTELGKMGLINADIYKATNHVVNNGVCEQLDYRKKKSEAGKKGLEKRWSKTSGKTDSTC